MHREEQAAARKGHVRPVQLGEARGRVAQVAHRRVAAARAHQHGDLQPQGGMQGGGGSGGASAAVLERWRRRRRYAGRPAAGAGPVLALPLRQQLRTATTALRLPKRTKLPPAIGTRRSRRRLALACLISAMSVTSAECVGLAFSTAASSGFDLSARCRKGRAFTCQELRGRLPRCSAARGQCWQGTTECTCHGGGTAGEAQRRSPAPLLSRLVCAFATCTNCNPVLTWPCWLRFCPLVHCRRRRRRAAWRRAGPPRASCRACAAFPASSAASAPASRASAPG